MYTSVGWRPMGARGRMTVNRQRHKPNFKIYWSKRISYINYMQGHVGKILCMLRYPMLYLQINLLNSRYCLNISI